MGAVSSSVREYPADAVVHYRQASSGPGAHPVPGRVPRSGAGEALAGVHRAGCRVDGPPSGLPARVRVPVQPPRRVQARAAVLPPSGAVRQARTRHLRHCCQICENAQSWPSWDPTSPQRSSSPSPRPPPLDASAPTAPRTSSPTPSSASTAERCSPLPDAGWAFAAPEPRRRWRHLQPREG